jgi:flavin-binding protein dodecin
MKQRRGRSKAIRTCNSLSIEVMEIRPMGGMVRHSQVTLKVGFTMEQAR